MERVSAARAISVFGGSDAQPGSSAYEVARDVGARLAEAGWLVQNGGYGGVMEASSRGAREAGGRSIGITTRAFTFRASGNAYLHEERPEADLFDRTRRLIDGAAGFIVLPGRTGTLAELAFLWALSKAGLLGDKPVILLGDPWSGLLDSLRRLDLLDPGALRTTRVVAGPRAAVEAIGAALGDARGERSPSRPGDGSVD